MGGGTSVGAIRGWMRLYNVHQHGLVGAVQGWPGGRGLDEGYLEQTRDQISTIFDFDEN